MVEDTRWQRKRKWKTMCIMEMCIMDLLRNGNGNMNENSNRNINIRPGGADDVARG